MAVMDLGQLSRLLDREVVSVEIERAPALGLERAVALVLAPRTRFEIPQGNRLSTLSDFAEIAALLDGWPRTSAAGLRQQLREAPVPGGITGGITGDRAPERVAEALAAWRADPALADAASALASPASTSPANAEEPR